MNCVLAYLSQNRQQLDLDALGISKRPSCVILTPRFRASSHIVALVLQQGRPEPSLVVKIPRLAGDDTALTREAECLQSIQVSRPGGFDTLPRVVAFDRFHGRRILVQTALVGRVMDPPLVRRRLDFCITSVVDWLDEISPVRRPIAPAEWFEPCVEQPLGQLEAFVSSSVDQPELIERTRGLVEPLRQMHLPLVAAHGDLSAPNVMLLNNSRVGAVDWECGEPRGLPAADFFFFLTYTAFARKRAGRAGSHVAAFHSAFFGPRAWARPYVLAYASRFQIPVEALTPLLALCWIRYVASLVGRLSGPRNGGHALDRETTDWLVHNRYWLMWRHTLEHADQLDWSKSGR